MFIPKDNEKDLADIPDSVKKALKIIPVAHVDDVIARALSRKPEPIEWEEPAEIVAAKPAEPWRSRMPAFRRSSRREMLGVGRLAALPPCRRAW